MLPYVFQNTVLLILPLLFIVSLWRSKDADRLRWLLKVGYTGAFLAYMLLLGRWDFSSFHLRYILAILYLGAVVKSYFTTRGLPLVSG